MGLDKVGLLGQMTVEAFRERARHLSGNSQGAPRQRIQLWVQSTWDDRQGSAFGSRFFQHTMPDKLHRLLENAEILAGGIPLEVDEHNGNTMEVDERLVRGLGSILPVQSGLILIKSDKGGDQV